MEIKIVYYCFLVIMLLLVVGCYVYVLYEVRSYKEKYDDFNVITQGPTGSVGPGGTQGRSGYNSNTGPAGPTGIYSTNVTPQTYTLKLGTANQDGQLFYWNIHDGGRVAIFASKLPTSWFNTGSPFIPINLIYDNTSSSNFYYIDGVTVNFQSIQITSSKSYTDGSFRNGSNGINYAGFDYSIGYVVGGNPSLAGEGGAPSLQANNWYLFINVINNEADFTADQNYQGYISQSRSLRSGSYFDLIYFIPTNFVKKIIIYGNSSTFLVLSSIICFNEANSNRELDLSSLGLANQSTVYKDDIFDYGPMNCINNNTQDLYSQTAIIDTNQYWSYEFTTPVNLNRIIISTIASLSTLQGCLLNIINDKGISIIDRLIVEPIEETFILSSIVY